MDLASNKSNNRINKALMMSEKEYIKSQHSIIDGFYKEYFTYDISNVGCWLLTGIFTFIQLIFFVIPMQQLIKEGIDSVILTIIAVLSVFPVFFYLQPFVIGNLNGRVAIYSRIKYLPVSLKSIRTYRFKKMLKFVFKIFLTGTVLQVGLSLLIFHCIIWQTVMFLLVYGFLIPFLVGLGVTIG